MKNIKAGSLLFSLQICLCLALNLAGARLAAYMNWPVWLDSIGTVLCTYLAGPFCGAVVGVTANLMRFLLNGNPWYYALISILIAIIVGIESRKRNLRNLLEAMTVGVILALVTTAAVYPFNLLLSDISTGNTWGDAVISFLAERGLPRRIGLMVGGFYVEMLDKMVSLLFLFVLLCIVTQIRKLTSRKKKAALDASEDDDSVEEEKTTDSEPAPSVPKEDGKSASSAAGTAALGISFCLLTLLLTASPVSAEETRSSYSDYVQTVYSSTNGLPCGEANDIAMTRDGVIWIGTYAGLYRYNGREFTGMLNYDSIRNVNCLYVDEEGRLWVGTNDNGLSIIINDEVANVITQDQGLPANAIKSIIKSSDGYYYIGTTGSMQVLTLNSGFKRVGTLTEVRYADHSAADDDGNVAAVDNDGTLFLLRRGEVICSRKLLGSDSVFKSCAFIPDGTLLAATTGNEIYRFDISSGSFEPLDVMECPGLRNIKNMYTLASGERMICADNGIAVLGTDGSYENINTNEFNNSIDNMLVDYQGNFWFTSSRLGLLRLAQSDFRDIYSTVGMENKVVNTIVKWQNAYYIGTDSGMDAVDPKGKTQISNAVTERFAKVRIRCMIVDSQDHLWICTYGSGLVELEPDGTEHLYNDESGAFGNRARVVKELSSGTILAAGDTGLSYIRDHEVIRTIDRSSGRISSMVLTITELPDTSVLVGTDGDGLAILKNGEIDRMLTHKDGLSSDVILRTVLDTKTGGVFVVCSNGLCYLDADGSIRTIDHFPYYNNYDIWTGDGDRLYVLSSAGIFQVDRTELLSGSEDLSYDLLSASRGLNASLTANAWVWYSEDDGDLYLPCDTGVFVISPDRLSSGTGAYRIKVSGVRLDGSLHQVDHNAALNIPHSVNRVEILPEILNYTIQNPYVGYILEGFDTDWTITSWSDLNTIPYTNLPTGNYTFRLAVFDNSLTSIVSERSFALTKQMEMYEESWFILYLIAIPIFVACWVAWLMFKRREMRMAAELEKANLQVEMGKQTVVAIARTVDAKDERTAEHSKRVAIYSKQIAKAYGMDEKQCQDIEWAAQMHDIGKIAIPDAILNKTSRLTDDEYAIMKSHTTRGAEILKDFTLLDNVIEGAEFHHERYDGRGYPKGLKGTEIPLYARIIGVADAFDAMTANRVYRKQMDFGYVLGELEKGRGTQFDPEFVDLLLKLINDGTINLNKIYHVSPEDAVPTGSETAGAAVSGTTGAEKGGKS